MSAKVNQTAKANLTKDKQYYDIEEIRAAVLCISLSIKLLEIYTIFKTEKCVVDSNSKTFLLKHSRALLDHSRALTQIKEYLCLLKTSLHKKVILTKKICGFTGKYLPFELKSIKVSPFEYCFHHHKTKYKELIGAAPRDSFALFDKYGYTESKRHAILASVRVGIDYIAENTRFLSRPTAVTFVTEKVKHNIRNSRVVIALAQDFLNGISPIDACISKMQYSCRRAVRMASKEATIQGYRISVEVTHKVIAIDDNIHETKIQFDEKQKDNNAKDDLKREDYNNCIFFDTSPNSRYGVYSMIKEDNGIGLDNCSKVKQIIHKSILDCALDTNDNAHVLSRLETAAKKFNRIRKRLNRKVL